MNDPAPQEVPPDRDRDRRRLSATEALDRLERLIEEERGSLRRRDAAHVAMLAGEKEMLLDALQRDRESLDRPAIERLRSASAGLRHNAILLAYARDALRDVLFVLGRRSGASASGARRVRVVG